MVYISDVAVYSVSYKNDDSCQLIRTKFTRLSQAESFAKSLKCLCFLDVSFSNKAGDSSISGSLYVYSVGEPRRPCNNYLIRIVNARKGA